MSSEALIKESQKLQQGPWKYLVELEITDELTAYLVNHHDNVVFDGNTYTGGIPFEVQEIKQNARGELVDTAIIIATAEESTIRDYIEQYDLVGKTCILRIVNLNLLDDAENKIEYLYKVGGVEDVGGAVQLGLMTSIDETLLKTPNRRIVKYRCTHTYRGEGCWLRVNKDPNTYTAPAAFTSITPGDNTGLSCTKILDDDDNGCLAHNNTERFGAFVGVSDIRVPLRIV